MVNTQHLKPIYNSTFKFYNKIILCLFFIFISNQIFSQELTNRTTFRLVFYNTENFFDAFNDSLTNNEEFLPGSSRNWTYHRYEVKRNNIYKVFVSLGGWNPPEIIGISEIENKEILNDLLYNTPFSKFEYHYVYAESRDIRGIDVAMLYNPKKFKVLISKGLRINPDRLGGEFTRDILYVKGIAEKNDTFHIFINHWPSRRSGQADTENKRIAAAELVRKTVDSLFTAQPNPKIVIMGDFNDEPVNVCLKEILKTNELIDIPLKNQLYNLSLNAYRNGLGTYKYRGVWTLFDQIIVSSALLDSSNNFNCTTKDYHIAEESFLLENDEKFTGKKPYSTYSGYKYQGGFSDHLPVYLDLKTK